MGGIAYFHEFSTPNTVLTSWPLKLKGGGGDHAIPREKRLGNNQLKKIILKHFVWFNSSFRLFFSKTILCVQFGLNSVKIFLRV
jgi:hypothetical protein